ncbi:helix-turn-helix domain-containing protein [Neobacillus vireti]|uniref:helix-turn-helix domain-containing protein n=1 Tax=Neobacillus vireti TaxID=220686 RepID=UPI002FFEAF32
MIGERIKKLRKQKGYSITELANLAKVSKSYLSNIERGLNKNPSIHFLMKIAKPLEVSIEYLLRGDNQEAAQTENDRKGILDKEWENIIGKAIEDGINKDDFIEYISYIKFKIWERNQLKKTNDWWYSKKKQEKL